MILGSNGSGAWLAWELWSVGVDQDGCESGADCGADVALVGAGLESDSSSEFSAAVSIEGATPACRAGSRAIRGSTHLNRSGLKPDARSKKSKSRKTRIVQVHRRVPLAAQRRFDCSTSE